MLYYTRKTIKMIIPSAEFDAIRTFCDCLDDHFDWGNEDACENLRTIFKAIYAHDYDTLDDMGIEISHDEY